MSKNLTKVDEPIFFTSDTHFYHRRILDFSTKEDSEIRRDRDGILVCCRVFIPFFLLSESGSVQTRKRNRG